MKAKKESKYCKWFCSDLCPNCNKPIAVGVLID